MTKIPQSCQRTKTRPIEDFWDILKGKVYSKNWSAKSIPELNRKI